MSEEQKQVEEVVVETPVACAIPVKESVVETVSLPVQAVSESTDVVINVAPLIESAHKEPEVPFMEMYHCNNCRIDLSPEMVTKMALDFKRNDDGSVSPMIARHSIFCKACNHFIRIVDPVVSRELKKIEDKK